MLGILMRPLEDLRNYICVSAYNGEVAPPFILTAPVRNKRGKLKARAT